MLNLSKKTDYAILLLTHLSGVENPVSAKDVSRYYSLPYPMVANILKKLVVEGILVSARGKGGGYLLSRSADLISLSDIIKAIEKPFYLVECCNSETFCIVRRNCPSRAPLKKINDQIKGFFEEAKLSLIINDSKSNNLIEKSKNEVTNLSRL